ncbi:MAG: short-chain dehydrogenase [Candidatus Marinimicrobia bacterium]|nr:short-chain dehydrogenase [Candidatus Neomarinimicrobiota bacterium]
MDINQRKVLVLGGWGLVGMAIIRELAIYKPKEIIVLSLTKAEAKDACRVISNEFSDIKLTPVWGNIFVRGALKDLNRQEIMNTPKYRAQLLEDVMEAFDEEKLIVSFLDQVISKHKPNIIIDSVNSATGLAYQDIYSGYYNLRQELLSTKPTGKLTGKLEEEIEKMLATLYIPQIIRHIQILHASMVKNGTGVYIKIGTTGTGGMGLNIPYTHSEEKPSRVLLSKTSLAGAHTMLLFLMGRTPDGPIVKEIKPAAAIAWKKIGYGEIYKHGKPIRLFDCAVENAIKLTDTWKFSGHDNWEEMGKNLESIYIDTGENGTFSLPEFEAITTAGQMEFVTPEEIAANTVLEIMGDSTGYDIISALDNSIMSPTYRAGYMRNSAIEEMKILQKVHRTESVAFEILGPPRLSKILYEAYLLKKICGDMRSITKVSAKSLVKKAEELIQSNSELRSNIISIGLPILLSDGISLIRGPIVKIPTKLGQDMVKMSQKDINQWAAAGWVDLRLKNMELWLKRINQILDQIDKLPVDDTSSRYHHGLYYWKDSEPLQIGKLASWIFINEDKGLRIKR